MKIENKSINISAPGKLVLCGEHAVLNGEPAMSLAINQRIFVKITQIDGSDVFVKSKFGNLVLNYNNDSKISNQHIPKWGLQISFLLSNIKLSSKPISFSFLKTYFLTSIFLLIKAQSVCSTFNLKYEFSIFDNYKEIHKKFNN